MITPATGNIAPNDEIRKTSSTLSQGFVPL